MNSFKHRYNLRKRARLGLERNTAVGEGGTRMALHISLKHGDQRSLWSTKVRARGLHSPAAHSVVSVTVLCSL